jgi:hypothetical protein
MQHLQSVVNTHVIMILNFNKQQEVTQMKIQFLP